VKLRRIIDADVPTLHTATAGHNHASHRVLQRNGFEIVPRSITSATARTVVLR
jgi:RimJ/RimL family protein N-acetyltransferase